MNGLVYSQTMSFSRVTSNTRPFVASQTSVLPLGSLCAPEQMAEKQLGLSSSW